METTAPGGFGKAGLPGGAGILPGSLSSAALQAAPPVRYRDSNLETADYRAAKPLLIGELLDLLDFQALEQFEPELKRRRVEEACSKILPRIPMPLTASQITLLKAQAVDELLGFGPIEPLLQDAEVADIMINTARRVYIEKKGKVYLTDIEFRDEQHLIGVVQRIVSRVGRRIDEANPMVDARMPDGSRFNAIIPPLALDGCLVSIRKFKKNKMPLTDYIALDSMSPAMATFLGICSAVRLNIIISGGTGSGKTTLLNALSGHIDASERVITIEDAAELQMHQPHVLRLETRPASTEGKGEVPQRALVRNALRMRPDRIILGEMRGDEVIDVLAAMNTGHDGSMATIHSNSPRDCLTRIENLVAMSSVQVSLNSLRYQIASAVNLIVQIQRMRDGGRRITHIEEILGFDGQNIQTQTIFHYRMRGIGPDGRLIGDFVVNPITSTQLINRTDYYGRTEEMLACLGNPGLGSTL
jgi:pilus assembly protein CpaF